MNIIDIVAIGFVLLFAIFVTYLITKQYYKEKIDELHLIENSLHNIINNLEAQRNSYKKKYEDALIHIGGNCIDEEIK